MELGLGRQGRVAGGLRQRVHAGGLRVHLLGRRGAKVTYTDPWIPQIKADGIVMESSEAAKACCEADCVVVVTDHKKFDFAGVVNSAKLVVDTRNATANVRQHREKIIRC